MRCALVLWLFAASVFAAGELSNRRAPGFSLPDATLKQHDPQDYRGKVLLVEIMQTNCPHCAAFAEILEDVQKKYAGKVQVLSIVNPPDNQNTVTRYVGGHHITFPVLFDCGQVSASYLKITPQNPSFNVPHVFVIDPQGFIRNDFGYDLTTRDIFEGRGLFQEIDRLLAAPRK